MLFVSALRKAKMLRAGCGGTVTPEAGSTTTAFHVNVGIIVTPCNPITYGHG